MGAASNSKTSLGKRITIAFAAFGFIFPFVVLIIDWLAGGWAPGWVYVLWPTSLVLMPYSGFYLDWEKAAAILGVAVANGGIYALVGFIVSIIFFRTSKS